MMFVIGKIETIYLAIFVRKINPLNQSRGENKHKSNYKLNQTKGVRKNMLITK